MNIEKNTNARVFNALLAEKIGLSESIMLQQIHYWCEVNKSKKQNYKDNHYWTYNTYQEWHRQFPFFSIKTIQRTIKNLESKCYIVTANYNSYKIDKTKWYRVNYPELETKTLCNKSVFHSVATYNPF